MEAPSTPDRPLGAAETMLWATDRVLPIHFTTFVTLRGPVEEELLREALMHVQRRHPPLRVRIRREGDALWFREVDESLPLDVRDAAEDEVDRALGAACIERVDSAHDPLLRPTLLRHGPDHATLLLRFHHAIGDGKSGVFLARDIVDTCNRRLRHGRSFTPLPSLAPTPAVESHLGLDPTSLGGLLGYAEAASSLLADILRPGKSLVLPRDGAAPYDRRTLAVVRHTWTDGETRALTRAAKKEGTTVHGALLAGLTKATLVSADHSGPLGAVLGSPVDVRERGQAPIGEALGFYVSLLASVHVVDRETYFWRLARETRAALVASLERGQHKNLALPQMTFVAPFVRREPRRLFDVVPRLSPTPTTGITNIGRFDLAAEPSAPVTIEHGGFVANPSFAGDFVSTATTLGGRLVWTACALEPVHSRERIAALLDDARNEVLAACRD